MHAWYRRKGGWLPGKVVMVTPDGHTSRYDVLYDDGDIDRALPEACVRLRDTGVGRAHDSAAAVVAEAVVVLAPVSDASDEQTAQLSSQFAVPDAVTVDAAGGLNDGGDVDLTATGTSAAASISDDGGQGSVGTAVGDTSAAMEMSVPDDGTRGRTAVASSEGGGGHDAAAVGYVDTPEVTGEAIVFIGEHLQDMATLFAQVAVRGNADRAPVGQLFESMDQYCVALG